MVLCFNERARAAESFRGNKTFQLMCFQKEFELKNLLDVGEDIKPRRPEDLTGVPPEGSGEDHQHGQV